MRLKVGTRPSPLAVKQAEEVANAYEKRGIECEIVRIETHGDMNRSAPLYGISERGVFVSSLNNALIDGRIDVAVHSAKDLPTELPQGLSISAVLKRECPNDSFVSHLTLKDMQPGSMIGTSSLRRSFMLKRVRSDIRISNIRGNVDTRLRKLEAGEYDGIVIAEAGLRRLGLSPKRELLSLDIFVPAPCQGIIGVVSGNGHPQIEDIASISDRITMDEMRIEREIVSFLNLGCSAPAGIYARKVENGIQIVSSFYSFDGTKHTDVSGKVTDPNDMKEFLDRIRTSVPSEYRMGGSE